MQGALLLSRSHQRLTSFAHSRKAGLSQKAARAIAAIVDTIRSPL